MNIKNVAIYGFAAFAAYTAYRTMAPSGGSAGGIFDMLRGQRRESGAAIPQNMQKVTEVLNGSGGQFGNGWRYFSDGTSIGPDGSYYSGGNLVWSPQ